MLSSGTLDHYWPLAERRGSDNNFGTLGIPSPELLPFGARAMAKGRLGSSEHNRGAIPWKGCKFGARQRA